MERRGKQEASSETVLVLYHFIDGGVEASTDKRTNHERILVAELRTRVALTVGELQESITNFSVVSPTSFNFPSPPTSVHHSLSQPKPDRFVPLRY